MQMFDSMKSEATGPLARSTTVQASTVQAAPKVVDLAKDPIRSNRQSPTNSIGYRSAGVCQCRYLTR
jgi:hypothetical protein